MKKGVGLLMVLGLTLSAVSGCRGQENGQRMASQREVILPQGQQMPLVVIPRLPENIRFAGERVPLENYDTRESLEREMMVSMYMHSRTITSIRATTRYFPIIEPILEKNGIPDDFKYLCVAESSLNPNAYSTAKAAGLWQLLSATGQQYGLVVNADVDERYHIEKSTEAACKYLKQAYAKYGNWTLAAASYNVGMAGVDRRLKSQEINDYYDLLAPEETMRYLFRIVSLKLMIEQPAKYGYIIEPDQYLKPYRYNEVGVSDAKINWTQVAKKNGTTYKILREMNPWIRGYEMANGAKKTYVVKVPQDNFRTE